MKTRLLLAMGLLASTAAAAATYP
ncbi:hypothetical protein PMI17_00726, partial [Pantoea sp. GM01]